MPRLLRTSLPLAALFFLSSLPMLAQTPLLPDSVASSGTLRNNYTGYVGMEFSFLASFQITSLGRAYFPGNSGTHTVKLVNASTGVDVPGASVQITMSPNGSSAFQYAALPSPVTLQGATNYLLLSSEVVGGDTWYDLENITPSGGYQTFSINGAVYSNSSGAYVVVPGTAGSSYVSANLLYGPTSSTGATVTITSPTNGQVIAATATSLSFAAAVSNLANGATLQFLLDGQNYGTAFPSSQNFLLAVSPTDFLGGSHTLTAVYSAPGASPVTSSPVTFSVPGELETFIKSQTPGPIRNNYSGFVGMGFGVDKNGSSSYQIEVSALGRYVWPGNSQTHLLKLYNATTGTDVYGGSATVSLNGATPGQYAYAYLPSSIVLNGANTYYLLSQETAGGDQWADYGPVATSQFPVYFPVYQAGSSYVPVNLGSAYSYVPLNLLIHQSFVNVVSPAPNASLSGIVGVGAIAAPLEAEFTITSYQLNVNGQAVGSPSASGSIAFDTTPFANGPYTLTVTATDNFYNNYTSAPIPVTISNSAGTTTTVSFVTAAQTTFLRNNYAGYVGMQFTVGAKPLAVESLGRFCVAGNSASHVIKLVHASTGIDVFGAVTSVNMSGCTPGQYVYAILPGSFLLAAGESFNLVDLETVGGDQWYDYSPIQTMTDAAVNGAVYSNSSGGYVLVPPASTSYVPLNFTYSLGGGTQPLTTAVQGFDGTTIYGAASGSSPITSVQFQIDGHSITPPVTSYPYQQTLTFTVNLGVHVFSSIAHDAAGDVATSAAFPTAVLGYSPNSEYVYPSLVTNSSGTLRNNYTGWVGFQFTQGGSLPIPGSSVSFPANTPVGMGTGCVAGNTQPHIVKIVRASDGVDLASTWINCALVGTVSSDVSWGIINLPGGLVPGQSYYLVAQETAGGDQFSDIAPAVPYKGVLGGNPQTTFVSNFTIDGPVYFDGSKYVLVPNLPNYSYAGMYLLGDLSLI